MTRNVNVILILAIKVAESLPYSCVLIALIMTTRMMCSLHLSTTCAEVTRLITGPVNLW